jgi:hypothetical protein
VRGCRGRPVDPFGSGDDGWSPFASSEEVALGSALAAADAAAHVGCDPAAPWDDVVPGDDDLVAALTGPAHEADLLLLASIDPRSLGDNLVRVRYLQALDRVAALVAARRADTVVAMVGERSGGAYLPEVHLEQEIAVARRTSRYSAGRTIEMSRALATTFPGFGAALRDGEVSEAHCAVLVERTRVVADPEVLAEIERQVLPRARRMTPGELGGEVAKAIARLDADAAGRLERARESRRVWSRPIEDGLGYLGLVHDWPTINAIQSAVTADGRALQLARGGAAAAAAGAEDATADACRADALTVRILGEVHDDGSVTWDRSNVAVTVSVVMDLDTLRAEADSLALVDGQPVPAKIAREVAALARSWRRLVTDPVTGHLLDYGREVYLPDRLRAYVLARDGGCHTPGCSNRAVSRLQMDHAIPFPDGPSDAANCRARCATCHQLKTAGYAEVLDSRPDGSSTWRTAWGQVVRVPPRPVLEAPGRAPTPPHGVADPPGPPPP